MKKRETLKQIIRRCVGIILAIAITISSTMIFYVYAENTAMDDFEISILETETRKDVITVSAQDTAEGDVTLRVGLYIDSEEWPDDDYIDMASAQWVASDSSWIHFTSIADLLTRSSEQQVISYSGGTYVSRFEPYCFVRTIRSSKYGQMETTRNLVVTTTSFAYDPAFGAAIYQAGENQVQFTYEYYASKEDREADVAEGVTKRKLLRECVCDVQYSSQGVPFIEYTYLQQDDFIERTKFCELPGYDADLEVGAAVPGLSDCFMMMYTGTSATRFFGASSDEFPLISFDIVLEQGIPSGIYSVDLDTNNTVLAGIKSKSHHASSVNGITIIVDENATRTTEPSVTTTTEIATTSVATETTQLTTTTPPVATSVTQTETSAVHTTSSSIDTTATYTDITSIENTETTTMTITTEKVNPILLDKTKTIYVGQSDEVVLYNAEDSLVAWVSEDPDILSVDGSAKTSAIITGKSPGKVNLYAIADGKALICEVTVVAEENLLLCGDVNLDSKISMSDLIRLLRAQVGTVELDYYAAKNADCNHDGNYTIIDATLLMRFLLTLIDNLPSDLN